MLDAADLQVWLEWNSGVAQVAPWVRSAAPGSARYLVVLVRESVAGRSELRQGGTVALRPGEGARLGSLAVNREPGDRCRILVDLFEGERRVFSGVYDCASQP